MGNLLMQSIRRQDILNIYTYFFFKFQFDLTLSEAVVNLWNHLILMPK